MKQTDIRPANGKLGIMVVGCGAVTTTFMTGVLMARKGLTKPVGSMTQYDKIRVGKGNEKKYLHYADIVPLASLDDIVFGTCTPRFLRRGTSNPYAMSLRKLCR